MSFGVTDAVRIFEEVDRDGNVNECMSSSLILTSFHIYKMKITCIQPNFCKNLLNSGF
jgi:hypothetical protein